MKQYTSVKEIFDFLASFMQEGNEFLHFEIRDKLAIRFQYDNDYASKKVKEMVSKIVLFKLVIDGAVYYKINQEFTPNKRVSPFKGMPAPKSKKKRKEVTSYLTSAGEFIIAMANMNGVKRWN